MTLEVSKIVYRRGDDMLLFILLLPFGDLLRGESFYISTYQNVPIRECGMNKTSCPI